MGGLARGGGSRGRHLPDGLVPRRPELATLPAGRPCLPLTSATSSRHAHTSSRPLPRDQGSQFVRKDWLGKREPFQVLGCVEKKPYAKQFSMTEISFTSRRLF